MSVRGGVAERLRRRYGNPMATLNNLLPILTVATALGCGLMAGLFFAFSNFVMKALASLPPGKGIAAMQAVNVAILNPLFLALFLGTALTSLLILVWAMTHLRQPGSFYLLAGGAFYLLGCILVTMIFNVPLNDALVAAAPDNPDSVAVWRNYVSVWTTWNHVRTLATLAAAASLTIGLYQLRPPPP